MLFRKIATFYFIDVCVYVPYETLCACMRMRSVSIGEVDDITHQYGDYLN